MNPFRWLPVLLLVASATLLCGQQRPPQSTGPAGRSLASVMGVVVAVDADSRLMIVKATSGPKPGENYTFVFDEAANYLSVPPGEKSLEKATPIALADVSRGDTVYGRGEPLEDARTVPVHRLIVMSKAAIEKKKTAEQEEWRRGIQGEIVELRPRTQEFTMFTARMPRQAAGSGGERSGGSGRGGSATEVTVQVSQKTTLLRFPWLARC